MAVNGIIGTWAGPDAPGTAYVLMHHSVGDIGDGQVASWGFIEGGMGAVAKACEESARVLRRRGPGERSPWPAITTSNGRVTGRRARRRRGAPGARWWSPRATRRSRSCSSSSAPELPEPFVHDIEHWKTRSGTVKVNLAIDRACPPSPPTRTSIPRSTAERSSCSTTSSSSSGAYQQARFGRRRRVPFSDTEIPTVVDHTLAPEGIHTISMFTQWVPGGLGGRRGRPLADELEAYADRLIDHMEEVAPGFRDSGARAPDHRPEADAGRAGI